MQALFNFLLKLKHSLFTLALLGGFILITGCSTTPPPKQTYDNICSIFKHDPTWKHAAQKSQKRWGTSPDILMAFIHQESRFKPDAQPPRAYALGMIPLPRASSSYGYSQAKDGTWGDYKKATKRSGASRSNIEDSLDFIGWYNYQSHKQLNISRKDPYKLYLAYHEGRGGYANRTYLKKPWLQNVAKKVANRSRMYQTQYARCR